MKKRLMVVFAALALLFLPAIALAPVAQANGVRSGESVIVKKDEVVDKTLFAAGNNIEIAGTVNGDIFCAGQNITVTGTVKGDVICAGQNIRVDGMVEGDVRLAGQVVSLAGAISGGATVASQTLTLENTGKVRDVVAAGESLTFNGEVLRDLTLASDAASLNGTVGRDVLTEGENLTLGSSSKTGGNITYHSNNKVNQQQGAEVTGKIEHKEPQYGAERKEESGWQTGAIIFMFITMLVAAMALVALFPRALQRVSTNAVEKPGTTALIGLAVVFLAPVFIVGLMLTGVGAMLGVILLLAYILLLVASGPVFGYYVGRMLLRGTTANPLLYMLLGVAVISLIYLIPVLGPLTMLAAGLLGTGMLVREVMRRGANPTYDLATEPAKPAASKSKKK